MFDRLVRLAFVVEDGLLPGFRSLLLDRELAADFEPLLTGLPAISKKKPSGRGGAESRVALGGATFGGMLLPFKLNQQDGRGTRMPKV